MTHTKVEAIYAIRHKESGEYIRANGKGCWMSVSALKSSWRNSWGYESLACKTFGVGSEYEVVDILGTYQYAVKACESADEIIECLLTKNIELKRQLEESHAENSRFLTALGW